MLDSLRQFVIDHHIATIPPSDPAHVIETSPFERSTTVASMDTPGPFETATVKAYYNVTLPDPRWPNAEREAYMRSWYPAMMANVSVHEVYPGHYVQFLYAKNFPSDVRKVFSANTNVEGWAHYDEQMMLDEGFHAGDPRYRLAQLQDALLRDTRFLVGIELHTQGLTIDSATKLFETRGHQPHPVAVAEAKRGAGDLLCGYYNRAKLMMSSFAMSTRRSKARRTRFRGSTMRFSRSARSRCRSFGGRCWGRAAICSRCVRQLSRAFAQVAHGGSNIFMSK